MQTLLRAGRSVLKDEAAINTFDQASSVFMIEADKYIKMKDALLAELPSAVDPKEMEALEPMLKEKLGFNTYDVMLQFEKAKEVFDYQLLPIIHRNYERTEKDPNLFSKSNTTGVSAKELIVKADAYLVALRAQKNGIEKAQDKFSDKAKVYVKGYISGEINDKPDISKINPIKYYVYDEIFKALLLEYQNKDIKAEIERIDASKVFLQKVQDKESLTKDELNLLEYLETKFNSNGFGSEKENNVFKVSSKILKISWLNTKDIGGSALSTYLAISLKDLIFLTAIKTGVGNNYVPKDAERNLRKIDYGDFFQQLKNRYTDLDTHKVFGAFILADIGTKITFDAVANYMSRISSNYLYRGTLGVVKGVGGYIIPLAIGEIFSKYYGTKLNLSYELNSKNPEIKKLANDVLDRTFPSSSYIEKEALSFAVSFGISHMIFESPKMIKRMMDTNGLAKDFNRSRCLDMRDALEKYMDNLRKPWWKNYLSSAPKLALNFATAEIFEELFVSDMFFSKEEKETYHKNVTDAYGKLMTLEIKNVTSELAGANGIVDFNKIFSKYDDSNLIKPIIEGLRKNTNRLSECLKLREQGLEQTKTCIMVLCNSLDKHGSEWLAFMAQNTSGKEQLGYQEKYALSINTTQHETELKEAINDKKELVLQEIDKRDKEANLDAAQKKQLQAEKEKIQRYYDPTLVTQSKLAMERMIAARVLISPYLEQGSYDQALLVIKSYLTNNKKLNIMDKDKHDTFISTDENAIYNQLRSIITGTADQKYFKNCSTTMDGITNLFYIEYPKMIEGINTPLIDMNLKQEILTSLAIGIYEKSCSLCTEQDKKEKNITLLLDIKKKFVESNSYTATDFEFVSKTIKAIGDKFDEQRLQKSNY
ncbi:MAG: hypothetical protein WCQ47_04060 [bacterium]